MSDDDKKYKVDWTMHDCEWSTGVDDYVYTSPYNQDIIFNNTKEVNIDYDLFNDFKDEELRDKYPELMAAWEQYQTLLDKYKMWDNVTNPPEEPDF
jgi:hypothetical protein